MTPNDNTRVITELVSVGLQQDGQLLELKSHGSGYQVTVVPHKRITPVVHNLTNKDLVALVIYENFRAYVPCLLAYKSEVWFWNIGHQIERLSKTLSTGTRIKIEIWQHHPSKLVETFTITLDVCLPSLTPTQLMN